MFMSNLIPAQLIMFVTFLITPPPRRQPPALIPLQSRFIHFIICMIFRIFTPFLRIFSVVCYDVFLVIKTSP